ncbi:MAG: hypothetical protein Q9184_000276 [Pyrenodesmia sp. 2 TL-2023]
MSKRELKLVTSKDWDPWLAIVRGKATGYRVRELVNPEVNIKPAVIPKPSRPTLKEPENEDAEVNLKALARYNFKMKKHKAEQADWKEKHESFTKLVEYNFDTISAACVIYLQDTIDGTMDPQVAFYTVMEKSLHYMRQREVKPKGAGSLHSAFAADNESDTSTGGAPFRNKSSFRCKPKEPPICVCGEPEWYTNCNYLRNDRPGRPPNFNPDLAKVELTEEALKD